MNVLVTETPNDNTYIASLINAYQDKGFTVICGAGNFYFSNYVPEVLHIQWPESLYLWQTFGLGNEIIPLLKERLIWFKKQGTRIVYTVHNLMPHDNNDNQSKDVFQFIISLSDIIVHHGEKSIEMLSEIYKIPSDTKQIICQHGDYLLVYKEITQEDARQRLGIPLDRFVILSVGNIKPYKNIEFLKVIFHKMDINKKYLLVAGRVVAPLFSRLFYTKIKWKIWQSNKQKWIMHLLSKEELQLVLSASDAILLTHKSGLTSGIIPLAATFKRAIVYPDVGIFKEQAEHCLSFNYKVGDISSAQVAMMSLYHKLQTMKKLPNNNEWLQKNSWLNHVQNIINSLQ